MKSLGTLIRLRQHEMDAAKRALNELEAHAESIEQRGRDLEAEFEAESARAYGDADASFAIGDYIAAVRQKRHGIDQERQAVAQEIALAEAKVRDAFRELKRFELAQTMEEDRAAKAAERQEQDRLDETALATYRENAEDYA